MMENLISTESTQKNILLDISSKKRKSKIIDIDQIPLNLNHSKKYYNKYIKKQNNYNDLIELKDEVGKIVQLNLKLQKQLIREKKDQEERRQLQKSIELMRQVKTDQKQKTYLGYLNELIILEKKNLSLKEQIIQAKKRNRSWTVNKKNDEIRDENKHNFSIFQLQKKIKNFVDDQKENPQNLMFSQQIKSRNSQKSLLKKTNKNYQTQLEKKVQKKNPKLNQLINKRLSKEEKGQDLQIKKDTKKRELPDRPSKIKENKIKARLSNKNSTPTKVSKHQKQKVVQNKEQNFQKNKNPKVQNNIQKKTNFKLQSKQNTNKKHQQKNLTNSDKKNAIIEFEYESLKQALITEQQQNNSFNENLSLEKSSSSNQSDDQSKNITSTITIIKDEKMHSEMFQEMNEENISAKSQSSDPESFERLVQERMENKQFLARYTFGFGKLEMNSQKQVCVNQFPITESIRELSISDDNQQKSFSTLQQKDSLAFSNLFEYKKHQEQSIKELDEGQTIIKHNINILSYKQDSKMNVFQIDEESSN